MKGKAVSSAKEKALVGLALVFMAIMLVVPLLSVLYNSLRGGVALYLSSISTVNVLSALRLSVSAMIVAVVVTGFFGLVASWFVSQYNFKGKQIFTTLVDVPFSVSPVIAGLAFIMTFGRLGWFYPYMESINAYFGTDLRIVFALPGVFLATIFVTFPFIFREVLTTLRGEGQDEEQMAALMGASLWTIYKDITFPKIKWALAYGIILCSARAIGEFGAVSAVAKTRGDNFTLPLEIDALYMGGSEKGMIAAFAVSSVLVIISLCLLIVRIILERRVDRQEA